MIQQISHITSLQKAGIKSELYKAYCITKNIFQEIEYYKIIGIKKELKIPIYITNKNRKKVLKIDRLTTAVLDKKSINLINDKNAQFHLTGNMTTYINNETVFRNKLSAISALKQIIQNNIRSQQSI